MRTCYITLSILSSRGWLACIIPARARGNCDKSDVFWTGKKEAEVEVVTIQMEGRRRSLDLGRCLFACFDGELDVDVDVDVDVLKDTIPYHTMILMHFFPLLSLLGVCRLCDLSYFMDLWAVRVERV